MTKKRHQQKLSSLKSREKKLKKKNQNSLRNGIVNNKIFNIHITGGPEGEGKEGKGIEKIL